MKNYFGFDYFALYISITNDNFHNTFFRLAFFNNRDTIWISFWRNCRYRWIHKFSQAIRFQPTLMPQTTTPYRLSLLSTTIYSTIGSDRFTNFQNTCKNNCAPVNVPVLNLLLRSSIHLWLAVNISPRKTKFLSFYSIINSFEFLSYSQVTAFQTPKS